MRPLKLEAPKNGNYAAVVKRVRTILPLPNRDKIVALPILGFQALVGKDTQEGDLVVVFPPETQLSQEFLHENNLYQHPTLNKDPEAKGYFDDNGRVKAVKFAGNRSDCFVAGLESLAYTGVDLSQLKESPPHNVAPCPHAPAPVEAPAMGAEELALPAREGRPSGPGLRSGCTGLQATQVVGPKGAGRCRRQHLSCHGRRHCTGTWRALVKIFWLVATTILGLATIGFSALGMYWLHAGQNTMVYPAAMRWVALATLACAISFFVCCSKWFLDLWSDE